MTNKITENKRRNGNYLAKFYVFILLYLAVSIFIAYLAARVNVSGNTLSPKIPTLAGTAASGKKTFIIDAGHGGMDGGAVGVDDISEKGINLAIAKKLERLLKTADIEVIMTRSEDKMLSDENASKKKASDLSNRVRIADNYPDAVFISIHMNKFPQEKYSGMQIFYSSNNLESANFADIIKKTNREFLQTDNNREIKRGKDIYILEHIKNPAVLVECGFLSNPAEAHLLCDDAYQNKMARLLFASILRYCAEIR